MKKKEKTGKAKLPNTAKKLKKAEETLHHSEERYRSILESIEDGYYEADLAGNLTFFNDSVCRHHGYSREEMMGMNYLQFADKDYSQTLFQVFNKVYTTGEPIKEFNWQIIRKDGTKRYIEASVSLLRDSSGEPIGFRGISRDITERKKTEELLKKSEAQYRLLADNMTEHIWLMDLNTVKIIYISPSVEKMYGYPPEEIINLPWKKFLTVKSFHKMLDAFSVELPKALVTLPPAIHIFSTELEARHKDGHLLWTDNTISFIRDENGKLVFMLGETRDITDRKRAEEDLRQAEERYRNIFENAQEGIYRSTPEGRFIMTNQAMARMLGYDSPDELIHGVTDINVQLYVHPEERKKVLEQIKGQGSAKDDELQFYRKDGSKIWVSRTMQAVCDEKGMLLYLDGLIEDITDRKNSVIQLRKALGGTVRAIASVVEAKDPYTAGHQRRVADLARAIAREMGLSHEQIEGLRMAGTIHDIGKVSVPAEILTSPRKLKDLEFSMIKIHTQSGYDMLKEIEFPWPVARMVFEHHERVNGSGYPNGLTRDDILLESRILSVADVVEAIATHRPYRASLGLEAALEEITKHKGLLYDADVVDACLCLFREKGYKIKE